MRIGIDLGGTKIEGVVLAADGKVLSRQRLLTPQQDYPATLDAIAELVGQLETECAVKDLTIPLGIAAPGSISRVSGRMKNCNSTCLNGQPLREDLQRLLKRNVRIANDADCFALSEAQDGAAASYGGMFGVILGTGVGGGVVINKQLLTGPNGIAGEWGHNPMPPAQFTPLDRHQPRACYCGRYDCVEAWLSGPAFEKSYYDVTSQKLSAVEISRAAASGESLAVELLDDYCDLLASALATVINVIDPEVVVLGGGLSNIDYLYEEVPRRWSRYIFTDFVETKLLRAKYGDSSGVRGAAWLW